ncbi:MAG: FHA domain-containing protein, partial [Deltaproteobacteria bacterium]|nr:FHA domain-containing protein [Deltaproteobacteria bacterium]
PPPTPPPPPPPPPSAPPASRPMASPPMASPPMAAPPSGPMAAPPMADVEPEANADGYEMADTVLADDISDLGFSTDSSVSDNSCPECGNEVPPGFKFCGNCGHKMESSPQMPVASFSPPAPEPEPEPEPEPVAKLIVQKPDNTFETVLELMEGETVIGRETHKAFATDSYMSPAHTRLTVEMGTILVEDLDSLNGTYIRVIQEEELFSGDIFRIGTEVMRYKDLPPPQKTADETVVIGSPNVDAWGRIEILTGPDSVGCAYVLSGEVIKVGREDGDITFPDDGYVSGEHLELNRMDDQVYLVDLNSSNGTYLKIREPREVEPGTLLLMGYQLYRIELI